MLQAVETIDEVVSNNFRAASMFPLLVVNVAMRRTIIEQELKA
jgi:hypothetical protein